jgi:hypothetical protein
MNYFRKSICALGLIFWGLLVIGSGVTLTSTPADAACQCPNGYSPAGNMCVGQNNAMIACSSTAYSSSFQILREREATMNIVSPNSVEIIDTAVREELFLKALGLNCTSSDNLRQNAA